MKLNIVFPWICVLGLSAGLAAVAVSNASKNTELAKLREVSQEAEQLRTDLDAAKTQSKAQLDEIAGLRNDKQELLKLRNEIGKLRDERQQLAKQLQTAQTQAERGVAQLAAARAEAQAAQRLQAENQQLRSTVTQSLQITQLNACINNLRMIDGAKQQWALENGKTADAIATAADVARYLKDNKLPTCPAGGTYTINAVNRPPTCSVPGHVLPQ